MAENDCQHCEKLRLALIDRENAQTDVTGKNRIINKLKAELSEQRTTAPDAEQVRTLLQLWKTQLGKNKRTAVPLDGARAQRVRWALKTYDELRLRSAIAGMARFPYQGPYGRRSATQRDGYKLDDDIRKICRDESTFEKFEALGMAKAEIAVERERLDMLDRLRKGNIAEICEAFDVGINELRQVCSEARA